MALEDLRQAVGQIAGKTFSGTLVQLKSQFRLSFSFGAADQHDVIGAFLSTAEQGVEKRLRAFRGEHAVKKGLIKNLAHIASSPTTGKKF